MYVLNKYTIAYFWGLKFRGISNMLLFLDINFHCAKFHENYNKNYLGFFSDVNINM